VCRTCGFEGFQRFCVGDQELFNNQKERDMRCSALLPSSFMSCITSWVCAREGCCIVKRNKCSDGGIEHRAAVL
jgi:hypothetical protein